MPAPTPLVWSILFNARLAETAAAGAGATLISNIVTGQFTTIAQNQGRLMISANAGGKSYSFQAMKTDDVMRGGQDAWQSWKSLSSTEIDTVLDSRRQTETLARFSGGNFGGSRI